MPDAEKPRDEVSMTLVQCNEVIEEQLTHLQPVMQHVLLEMERLKASLLNGEIHWRDLLRRAMKKHEKELKL